MTHSALASNTSSSTRPAAGPIIRLVGRMEAIDAEGLATLRDDILRPTVVEQAIALAFRGAEAGAAARGRRSSAIAARFPH
jgi:hypothetical protein